MLKNIAYKYIKTTEKKQIYLVSRRHLHLQNDYSHVFQKKDVNTV